MKKLILAGAALALAVVGFGDLRIPSIYANPAKIWVVNANVSASIASTPVTPGAFITAMLQNDTTRAPYLTQLDAFQAASGGQVAQTAAISAFSGQTLVVVQTDGSGTNVTLNGRGLVCGARTSTVSTISGNTAAIPTLITTAAAHNLSVGDFITITGSDSTPSINGVWAVATVPSATTLTLTGGPAVTTAGTAGTITPFPACDAVATAAPNATDHIVVFPVLSAGAHSVGDTLAVTAQQDAVTLDSNTMTVVGQAHDVELSVASDRTGTLTKSSLLGGAPSCLPTDDPSDPHRAVALGTYTDVNGSALVGYQPSYGTSDSSIVELSATTAVSMIPQGAANANAGVVICGESAGSATITLTTAPGELQNLAGSVTRQWIESVVPPSSTPTPTDTVTSTPTPTNTPVPPQATATSSATATPTSTPVQCLVKGQKVSLGIGILLRLGVRVGQHRYKARYDLNHDGVIDKLDLLVLLNIPTCHRGRGHPGGDD